MTGVSSASPRPAPGWAALGVNAGLVPAFGVAQRTAKPGVRQGAAAVRESNPGTRRARRASARPRGRQAGVKLALRQGTRRRAVDSKSRPALLCAADELFRGLRGHHSKCHRNCRIVSSSGAPARPVWECLARAASQCVTGPPQWAAPRRLAPSPARPAAPDESQSCSVIHARILKFREISRE